ncbi:MAG TPA: ShlB/FhaC/HecB family hemolysin secretion/activation protein [Tepidisphaeraceae bacterium]|jgi:hemolysin activation/secretion protein|nr:ShlB/FhaC/HecB family hemolysin secretion/activation protein [Tepidisphaeraceae bacterium]
MSKQIFVAAIMALLLARTASAQDAQRLAPKVPPANPPAQLRPPAATTQPQGSQLVVEHLQGLVFLDSPEKVHESSDVRGIDVSGASLLSSPKFTAGVSGYLGKPLTLAKLNEICQFVVAYCRGIDRPVVDAIVPQQDVTTGTVQIVVLQGHIGKIIAEGNKFFPSKMLISAVRAKSGDEISQNQLLNDVDWLNRNPFRRTDVVLQRGSEFGQTDVVLDTEDHFPLRLYTGYENTGTVATGEDRWMAGLNWGEAFGLDDQFNYQYTMGDNTERFQAHSASYVAPLPWRDVLTIFGNWSTSDVQTDPNIFQTGQSWQISARYEIPLPRMCGITQSIQFGGDFKRSNTNADFGGFSVYSSYVNVVQFMLGYNAAETDSRGSGDLSLAGYFSPGYIGSQDDRADYDNARVGADPQYAYGLLTTDRTTNLPANFSWLVRFQGQLATGPLLGSEQLGVGGIDSVRGYFEREGNGDDGLILSNELHTPPMSFLKIAGRKDQLYFLAFLDYGVAYMRDAQPGQFSQENFLGAGPGVSYHLGPWLSVDYAYGWRLANGDPTVHASGRNHLRILASFTY